MQVMSAPEASDNLELNNSEKDRTGLEVSIRENDRSTASRCLIPPPASKIQGSL